MIGQGEVARLGFYRQEDFWRLKTYDQRQRLTKYDQIRA